MLVERGELVLVYFLIGSLIPLLLILYLKRRVILKTLRRLLDVTDERGCFPSPCSDKAGSKDKDADFDRNEVEEEDDDQCERDVPSPVANSSPLLHTEMAVMRRVSELDAKKAKRSKLRQFIIASAIGQTHVGQLWVCIHVRSQCVPVMLYYALSSHFPRHSRMRINFVHLAYLTELRRNWGLQQSNVDCLSLP